MIIAMKGRNPVALWSYAVLSVWYSMPTVMKIGHKHRFEQVWACI